MTGVRHLLKTFIFGPGNLGVQSRMCSEEVPQKGRDIPVWGLEGIGDNNSQLTGYLKIASC